MPKVLPLGVVLQRLGIVAYGILVLLLLNTRQAAQLVEVDNVGVTVYSFRTVGFGTGEIVQIVLGNSPEEPRLVEIRLGGYGLIKILDAEHVVLVIECRPAYHDQPVGIELCKTG